MHRPFLPLVVSFLCSLTAQQPAAPPAPLPAPGSPAANALIAGALAKMAAYGRGTFVTREVQDYQGMRGNRMPTGMGDTKVEGGWYRDLVWAVDGDNHYVRANGRMLAKVDDGWRLRASKLADGRPAPFTLDPVLLLHVLAELTPAQRDCVHVEAGQIDGKGVTILNCQLEEDAAAEFVQAGVVPAPDAGFGGPTMFARMRGTRMPRSTHSVYVSFAISTAGDLLRCNVKLYEKTPRPAGMVVQVTGPDDEEEKGKGQQDKDAAEAEAGGPMTWRDGLPQRKPGKDESMTTFTIDFAQLGLAEPPPLDDKAKALLRVR
jgi:hypothetical protein